MQIKFAKMDAIKTNVQEVVSSIHDAELKQIGEKILNGERINFDEGVLLFEKGSLSFLGSMANWVREQMHGDKTFFNRNFHIEPTNVCVFACNFCSYSRLYAHVLHLSLASKSRAATPVI